MLRKETFPGQKGTGNNFRASNFLPGPFTAVVISRDAVSLQMLEKALPIDNSFSLLTIWYNR